MILKLMILLGIYYYADLREEGIIRKIEEDYMNIKLPYNQGL